MLKQLVINAFKFSHAADSLSGSILPENFSRLRDSLADNVGRIDYQLSGDVDKHGRLVLRVAIHGMINLCCQRCLDKMPYPLSLESELILAKNEGELARYDEDSLVDAIPASEELDAFALIEDEIILGLPFSPRHADITCQQTGKPHKTQNQANKAHPFAALKSLKQSH